MKVRATQRGHYGHVREPGDEFEVPDHWVATWFVPVEAKAEDHPILPVDEPRKRGRPKSKSL